MRDRHQAIVQPDFKKKASIVSSASVERLFSLVASQLHDNQKMKSPTTLSSKKFKDIAVEFPDESLIVNNGELFCTLYDKQLLTKRSLLVNIINRFLVAMLRGTISVSKALTTSSRTH